MNPENQDFENLRRLLKLKRYEQPPPRYFNDFSSQVINRIQAERARGKAATGEAPWFQRFMEFFERKPVVAGVFGAAVCALLVGGTVYSEYVEAPMAAQEMGGLQPVVAATAAAAPAIAAPAFQSANHSALHLPGSTNPVNLFDIQSSLSPMQGQPVRHTFR